MMVPLNQLLWIVQAGSYYGLWGTLLFLYGIPIGGLIDALGEDFCNDIAESTLQGLVHTLSNMRSDSSSSISTTPPCLASKCTMLREFPGHAA